MRCRFPALAVFLFAVGCGEESITAEQLFANSSQPLTFDFDSVTPDGPPTTAVRIGDQIFKFAEGENTVVFTTPENPNPGGSIPQRVDMQYFDDSEGQLVTFMRVTAGGDWFKTRADFEQAYRVGTHRLDGGAVEADRFEVSLHRDPTGTHDDVDYFSTENKIENVRRGSKFEITDSTVDSSKLEVGIRATFDVTLRDGVLPDPLVIEQGVFVGRFVGNDCANYVEQRGLINACTHPGLPFIGSTKDEGPGPAGGEVGGLPNPLAPWLLSNAYSSWATESMAHDTPDSMGHHGGFVKAYLNDTLVQSLTSSASSHPVGSAAVLETGHVDPRNQAFTMSGFAVLVKLTDVGDEYDWWWGAAQPAPGTMTGISYTIASADAEDRTEAGQCRACHEMGGSDMIRTRFPLR